jgi:hypothetical protein
MKNYKHLKSINIRINKYLLNSKFYEILSAIYRPSNFRNNLDYNLPPEVQIVQESINTHLSRLNLIRNQINWDGHGGSHL